MFDSSSDRIWHAFEQERGGGGRKGEYGSGVMAPDPQCGPIQGVSGVLEEIALHSDDTSDKG